MSPVSRTPAECSKTSWARTATVRAAASPNVIEPSSPGISRALAICAAHYRASRLAVHRASPRDAPCGALPSRSVTSGPPAILVRDLRKSYGELEAVRGIDFEVAAGEVFGLLGPNGAGKTTTVEILEGYRKRTGGIVSVLGQDPGERSARAARARRHRPAERAGCTGT